LAPGSLCFFFRGEFFAPPKTTGFFVFFFGRPLSRTPPWGQRQAKRKHPAPLFFPRPPPGPSGLFPAPPTPKADSSPRNFFSGPTAPPCAHPPPFPFYFLDRGLEKPAAGENLLDPSPEIAGPPGLNAPAFRSKSNRLGRLYAEPETRIAPPCPFFFFFAVRPQKPGLSPEACFFECCRRIVWRKTEEIQMALTT